MKIKNAKAIIKHEVATNGVVTTEAMRVYCEHRISYETFKILVKDGKRIYSSI